MRFHSTSLIDIRPNAVRPNGRAWPNLSGHNFPYPAHSRSDRLSNSSPGTNPHAETYISGVGFAMQVPA